MGLKRLHIGVTFIKSFLKTVNILSLRESHATVCFAGAFGGPWELSATGLSDIYICRLQKWGREVLEVLEVPVVCSPEPTANCLHAH